MREVEAVKRILVLVLSLALLTACAPDWDVPPLVIGPEDSPGSPSQQPTSQPLPEGPPSSHGFGLAWSPVTRLEPLTENGSLNQAILPLMYEGLFEVDASFEIHPKLCVSAETTDNTNFVLQLADAVFSDGSPLSAEDVVYSFSQARASASPYAAQLKAVSSVTAQDGAVLVQLTGQRSRFTALLSFPIVRKNAEAGLPAPPGTGMYVLRYDEEGAAILAPNPYRPDSESLRPYRIDLLDARDAANLSFYFQYRHIGAVAYDFNDPTQPGLHSGFERYDYPTGTMQYIGVSARSGPLQEPIVRKALSVALDREGFCADIFNGNAEPACLPVPPGSALYDPELTKPYAFDTVSALRLLSDAGCVDKDADGVLEWPVGRRTEPLRFTMAVSAENPAREKAARRYSKDLASAGISLEVFVLPWKDYIKAVEEGLYDLYWAQAALSADFDMSVFLLPGGALNYGSVTPSGAAAALEAMRTAGPDDQLAAGTLNQLWLEEAPFITICFNKKSLITQRGLFRAPTPAAGNLYYGFSEWELMYDDYE